MKTTLQQLYNAFLHASCVTTDSRRVPQHSIFFALKGDNFNGNTFASAALQEGASFVVVDEGSYPDDPYYMEVENVLLALQQVAQLHRRTLQTPIIAITGTNGKTTTKELTAAVLKSTYNILFTEGNLNNHIGVPLTLLRLTPAHQLAVIEMGASHPGDIRELVEIAEPNYGLITNVGKAHLQGFGSFEGVVATKTEMYHYLRHHQGGVIIDADNSILMEHAEGLQLTTYGSSPNAFVVGHTLPSSGYLTCEWTHRRVTHSLTTQLVGDYNLKNLLAAITIGILFNVPSADINRSIAQYRPNNNRSMLLTTPLNTLIVDAYNANPSSMQAAISNFSEMVTPLPKALILGDMRELGSDSSTEHQTIVDQLLQLNLQEVYLCGEEYCATRHAHYLTFRTTDELLTHLTLHPITSHTILIKGSRGLAMEKCVPLL